VFDLLSTERAEDRLSAAAQDLFERFTPNDAAVCREILAAEVSDQAMLLPLIAEKTLDSLEMKTRWTSADKVKWLLGRMLRSKLPLSESDLIRLARRTGTLRSHWRFNTIVPLAPLLAAIEDHVETNGLSLEFRAALTALLGRVAPYKLNRRMAARINALLEA
jgi:hypothetical protein